MTLKDIYVEDGDCTYIGSQVFGNIIFFQK